MLTGEGHLYDSVSVETYFVLWKCAAVTVVTRKKKIFAFPSVVAYFLNVFFKVHMCV